MNASSVEGTIDIDQVCALFNHIRHTDTSNHQDIWPSVYRMCKQIEGVDLRPVINGSNEDPRAAKAAWNYLFGFNLFHSQLEGLLNDSDIPSETREKYRIFGEYMFGYIMPYCAVVNLRTGRPVYPTEIHELTKMDGAQWRGLAG